MNNKAIDRGGNVTKVEVPAEWSKLPPTKVEAKADVPKFIERCCIAGLLHKKVMIFQLAHSQVVKMELSIQVPRNTKTRYCSRCTRVATGKLYPM